MVRVVLRCALLSTAVPLLLGAEGRLPPPSGGLVLVPLGHVRSWLLVPPRAFSGACAVMAAAAAAPPVRARLPELVPVQLTMGSSRGTLQDWVLWPVAAADEELAEFSEGFVRDLGVPLHFRRPVSCGAQARCLSNPSTLLRPCYSKQ